MSRYIFKMPDLGEGTVSAEVVAWHVKPGDLVQEDQVMCEVDDREGRGGNARAGHRTHRVRHRSAGRHGCRGVRARRVRHRRHLRRGGRCAGREDAVTAGARADDAADPGGWSAAQSARLRQGERTAAREATGRGGREWSCLRRNRRDRHPQARDGFSRQSSPRRRGRARSIHRRRHRLRRPHRAGRHRLGAGLRRRAAARRHR